MILIPEKKILPAEIEKLTEIYPTYIKFVVDVEKGILAAGAEYHIECEEVLINKGCQQKNLYGGGINLQNNKIEYMAMSNYKPHYQMLTYEIADLKLREKIKTIVQKFFGDIYE